MTEATFHRQTEIEADAPTLVEGLPGYGLVASIAVDQITDQLGLERKGTIQSPAFPPVASFTDGLIQDTVRVHAGSDPAVTMLRSDVPLPEEAYDPLAHCILNDIASEFRRAIFIAGAPARSEEQKGRVTGIATTEEVKRELVDAGIEVTEDAGIIGGVTGALVEASYREDVSASLLLVRADPYVPDPAAARSVIENAIEPLVEFDIETEALLDQAETIQQRKQQIAQQLRQLSGGAETEPPQAQSMFQ